MQRLNSHKDALHKTATPDEGDSCPKKRGPKRKAPEDLADKTKQKYADTATAIIWGLKIRSVLILK